MHRALLLPLALLIALPLPAAERVALVIGNDAYQHARKLNAAVNDATAVAGALEKLDFEVVRATNAGLDDMMLAMETVKQKAVGADAVLVFYAGHGVESGGVNYLVPVDALLEREIHLKKQTVSLDEILADLKTLNVPARMVILDCCRDNPIEGRSWLATRSAGGGGLAALSQDTLAEATLVVYAASPGKPALDRVGNTDTHSPFTAALLAELPKPGAHSFEMFGKVEDTVIQSTDGRQAPRLFYNGSTQPFRNFFFATAIPVPAPQNTAPAPTPIPQPAAPVMTQEAPPAPAPSFPTPADTPPTPAISLALPSRGYFSTDELFATGPYAAYNSYSQSRLLKMAQEKLKALGHYTGTPDGVTGPGTQRALITWQQSTALPVTGRLDATSLEKLGLTGISQMTAPAPVQRPTPSRPAPSRPKPRPPADDFFRNS
jgi:hypothetical protein